MMSAHAYLETSICFNLPWKDFSATPRTFTNNALVIRHFQVQLWLEAISYEDRF